METCPYCNEFMEIAAERADCPHLCADQKNEWCCLNCNAHFDLDLKEVPIDDEFAISQRPSTPAQNPAQDSTHPLTPSAQGGGINPNEQDSTQESNTESSKGDSSAESKEEQSESKGESSQESSTGQKDDSDSKENPSQPTTPQSPQNLTLASQKQITLAKQIYTSLKSYNNYTKINTDIIPVITSLQDYLAQDFLAKESIA